MAESIDHPTTTGFRAWLGRRNAGPLHPVEASRIHARRERVFLILAGLFLGTLAEEMLRDPRQHLLVRHYLRRHESLPHEALEVRPRRQLLAHVAALGVADCPCL